MRRLATVEILVLLILCLVAGILRFYRLDELPIGLWRDEAANGLEALQVLHGTRALFFGTREPMFIYLVAASVAFLGTTPVAIRIVAAIVGTATVPVTYLLVRELFSSTGQRSKLVAFLASVGLAISYWHLNFSRLGFRGILLPLLASLSFYFLWKGWNKLYGTDSSNASTCRSILRPFGAAGLCLGLTMYTYTPARFLPFCLLPLVCHAIVNRWRSRPRLSHARGDPRFAVGPLTAFALFGLAFLLVFAPLGAHFLADPRSFFARTGVTVFNASLDQPLVVVLAKNAATQLAMFGLAADPNTRHNPAGRPAFDVPTVFFFLLGAAVSARRSRELPYTFSLTWFFVMLVPAMVTFPELPHSLRSIGALPVAYVFPALGVESAWQRLRSKGASFKMQCAFAGLVATALTMTALLTYRDYFAPAVEEIDLVKAFDPRLVKVASLMNSLDRPDGVWILPLGPHGEQRMAYYVIDFLYQGKAPHYYVSLDEATVAQSLTEACRGKQQAMVLTRMGESQDQTWFDLYPDRKGLIPFMFDKHGELVQHVHFDEFDLLVYRLPENVSFSTTVGFESLDIDLGREVKLMGLSCGDTAASSCGLWFVALWKAEAPPSADCVAKIELRDGTGKKVSTWDTLLLDSAGQTTSFWLPGQQGTGYYTALELPEAEIARYNLTVELYDEEVGDVPATRSKVISLRLSNHSEGSCRVESFGVPDTASPDVP